jgi:hypothetical protein
MLVITRGCATLRCALPFNYVTATDLDHFICQLKSIPYKMPLDTYHSPLALEDYSNQSVSFRMRFCLGGGAAYNEYFCHSLLFSAL